MHEARIGNVYIESAENNWSVWGKLGDGMPNQTQGFGGHAEEKIPQRKSATYWDGRQPWRITVAIMIDGFKDDKSVEDRCRNLEKLAGGGIAGPPPKLRWSTGGVVQHDWSVNGAKHVLWVIDGLAGGDAIRNDDGDRVRANFDITFLEWNGDEYTATDVAETHRNKKAKGKKKSKKKTHRVKQGETLERIAWELLNDHRRWTDIAKLNGIRDPGRINEGQVLKIP